MDWETIVIAILPAIAGGGTFAAIVTARVSKKLGQEANEIEASKTHNSMWEGYSKEIREMFLIERDRFHTERQEMESKLERTIGEFEDLQKRVSDLEKREVRATRYIEQLKAHIWQRLPPPPPEPNSFDLD